MILPQSQCLYVIENTEIPRFKVGISSKVYDRFKIIQSTSGCKMDMVMLFPPLLNARDIEQEIHKELSDYRLIGEWFSCDLEKINTTINKVCAKSAQQCPIALKYIEGYKVNEIAEEYNVSRTAIIKHLKERNSYKEAMKLGFYLPETVPNDIESDKALSKAKLKEMARRNQEKLRVKKQRI